MASPLHTPTNTEGFVSKILAASLVLLLLLSLVGGILTVGDHLADLHPVLGWLFYLVLAIVLGLGVAYPLLQISKRPVFGLYKLKSPDTREQDRYRRLLADNLLVHGSLTDEQRRMLETYLQRADSQGVADIFTSTCAPLIDAQVKSSAKQAFFVSMVAHNSLVETASMLSISLELVRSVVEVCGFRPTKAGLAKLYIRVMASALIAGGVENMDLDDLFDQALGGGFGGKASGIILGSATDGLVGAFLVFRIGVITRDMLFAQDAPVKRETERKVSFQEAIDLMKSTGFVVEMLDWVKTEAADVAKSATSAVQSKVQDGLSHLVSSARRFAASTTAEAKRP